MKPERIMPADDIARLVTDAAGAADDAELARCYRLGSLTMADIAQAIDAIGGVIAVSPLPGWS